MNDFDFLKEFGKNLDRERPFEPVEGDWDKIATTLDARKLGQRRRRLLLAWIFPVAVSMIFTMLGTILWQTKTRADHMQTELARLQKVLDSNNSTSMADTTIQKISIIRYDTVYRTIVIRKYLPDMTESQYATNKVQQQDSILNATKSPQIGVNTPLKKNQDAALNTKKNLDIDHAVAAEPLQAIRVKSTAASPASAATNATDSLKNLPSGQSNLPKNPGVANTPDLPKIGIRPALNTSLSMLPSKNMWPLKSQLKRVHPSVAAMAVTAPALVSPHVPLIRRLRPHDAIVGIAGGILFPKTEEATSLNNYSLGINGQIPFGRHLRLLAGADHGWTNFNVKSSSLDNTNIPILTPPTPNDLLEHVQVKQALWSFSLGLRYIFIPDNRLRPFLSTAFVAEQPQEQTLKYEFRNQVTEEETYVLVPRNDAGSITSGLQMGAGIEWAFAKQLSFELEGKYQRQFTTAVPLLMERWGMKAGLSYRF